VAFGLGQERVDLGAWSESRRVPPSRPRLRRPVNEGPLRSRLLIALRARVGLRTGVSDSPSWLSGNGRPSWPAPFGPLPFEPLACGYRPRGWHTPALSTTEVDCGKSKSEEPGFASLLGTLACLWRMASVALGVLRVRAHRALLPSPRITRSTTYLPWCRSPRCGRTTNRAVTPYLAPCSFTPRAARPTRHLSLRKSRRVAPSGPVAAGEGCERKKPAGGRPGRPAVSAEPGGRIGNLRSKPDPDRTRVGAHDVRESGTRPRQRPFLSGSP
jgi:hypothetical protein